MVFLKLTTIKYYILYYIIIIIINKVNSIFVTIQNEKDLINYINTTNNDELTINIGKGIIDISSPIEIKNDFKILSIVGLSNKVSQLNFNNLTTSLIFNSFIHQIKIENLSIEGYLNFKKYTNIHFHNVILNGNLEINSTKDGNETINFDHFEFHSLIEPNIKRDNCIELSGTVIINESSFYGNSYCMSSIINYNGDNNVYFNITKSYFDGVYSNNCLSITNSNLTYIESTNFERGASYDSDTGGYAVIILKLNVK